MDSFDIGQDTLDYRGANENSRKRCLWFMIWRMQEWQVQISLKAFHVSAEVIPIDANIKTSNELLTSSLRAVGRLCKQDQTCAGAPRWVSMNSRTRSANIAGAGPRWHT